MWTGIGLAALAVAAATAVIYPLKSVAPAVSLSVVYLPAVLLVSAYWGLALGLATSLASAAAFNFFHIPPVGRFTISDARNWVALAAFVAVAVVVSTVADLARSRTAEAKRRREEADLAAGLARELLAGAQTSEVLGSTARRLAEAMTLPSVAIELGVVPPEPRRLAMALRGPDGEQVATLLVPTHLPPETIERLRDHVVGPLGALVAIALHRIDPSERERIFEPFYRGHGPAGEPWTGSGLGLAIAKGFIEANHGTISVESLPGQGTTFVASLPVHDSAPVEAAV
jgi:two-component system, OmpR family, sensor histidine kinase KdpD